MSAPSPVQLATSVVGFTVTCNGKALDASIQIQSIDVWTGVNKLPKARLVISDGSAAEENFPLSEGADLIPGVAIVIAAGYGGNESTIFSGIIYRQGLEASKDGASRLVVEATDKAMAMTIARKNAVFEKVTDSQLCEKLISAAGLSAAVTSTSTVHETIVQYYACDWDLLILRAQASGMVVSVADAKVTVAPPDTGKSPVLTLTYGESLLDFRSEMDASTQLSSSAVQSFAWDPETQALAQSSTGQTNVTTPGNLSSDQLAKVFGVSAYVQQTAGDMVAGELTQWSSAELLRRQLAKIRGSARFLGSALVAPGNMVTLAGLGARFNGNGYVSAVHHRLSHGLWTATVELGLSPDWFASSAPNVTAPAASGQLPGANNLQSGVVKQIDQDPDGEYRVMVTLPLLQAQGGTGMWARFGSYYASNGIGSCFYPEIGDEVIVGFLSGDPRYPVILGSLYSKAKPPPVPPQSENNKKTLMSRAKVHIDILEDKPALQLETPANQSIVIDDEAGSITIKDKNGNSITLDSGGIAIKSASDITLSATGSISMTAQNAWSATGTASAKLSSTAMVTISGTTGVALNP